jgi:hypothetical protein
VSGTGTPSHDAKVARYRVDMQRLGVRFPPPLFPLQRLLRVLGWRIRPLYFQSPLAIAADVLAWNAISLGPATAVAFVLGPVALAWSVVALALSMVVVWPVLVVRRRAGLRLPRWEEYQGGTAASARATVFE